MLTKRVHYVRWRRQRCVQRSATINDAFGVSNKNTAFVASFPHFISFKSDCTVNLMALIMPTSCLRVRHSCVGTTHHTIHKSPLPHTIFMTKMVWSEHPC